MTMYEHPYRLDAVFVQHLFERLYGVRSTSRNHIPSDPEATPVFLVSVEELTTLINVAFWASFKKEEGRSVPIALQYAPPDKAESPFLFQHPLPYTDEHLIRISHIPPNLVVRRITAHRKPPDVRICRLRNQSRVGTVPPSTSTPQWPAC